MNRIFDEVSSAVVREDFEKAKNLGEFFKRNESKMMDFPLSVYLEELRSEKGLRIADVIRGSGLTKSYVHQIFKGERKPSREKLLAIGFGLKLKEVEMQRMLRLGECSELYIKNSRDVIILACVKKGYTLDQTNDILYALDKKIIDEEK